MSNGFDIWRKDELFGPKEADHWEFYESRFNLKGSFPVELADIVFSTKNIPNEPETINAPSNLETLLAGSKTKIMV